MKRAIALILALCLLISITPAFAAKQMNDDVPVWTEETVRQYALDYIEGKSMSRLWGYYDLQIRRYLPMTTYETMLTELEWMTGEFVELGSYYTYAEPERETKTHVLHLCMAKQDLDMYFTTKDKEDDWEIMALEFVPADSEMISNGSDMLVDEDGRAASVKPKYTEEAVTVGAQSLSGMLTMPVEASATTPVPACVLVHEAQGADMNGTIGSTTFLKDVAEALGEMGVAAIRYDRRTISADETVWEEVVEDAIAAGNLLAADERVDATRLTVLGLGFGAMQVPRIVSQSEGVFRAMVLVGGTPANYADVLLSQPEATAGLSAEEAEALRTNVNALDDMSEDEAKAITLFGHSGYYFWDMAQYDQARLIKRLKLPTYIAQGNKDAWVTEDDGWRAYSEEIGDGITYVSFKSFRGLNHLLMNDLALNADGQPEYAVETHLDTQAGRIIAQWILNLYANTEE